MARWMVVCNRSRRSVRRRRPPPRWVWVSTGRGGRKTDGPPHFAHSRLGVRKFSPSTAKTDRVEKLQIYFAAKVPHYWLIDPIEGSLEIFRRTDLAYALVQSAHRGQLRPEPFDALEFSVDELLGDDPEDKE